MMRKKLTLSHKRVLLGLVFIAPWLFGFVFLFATPLIQSIKFSFNHLTIVSGGYQLEFVGWSNFKYALFEDATFNRMLTESVGAMAVNVPLILFFSYSRRRSSTRSSAAVRWLVPCSSCRLF